MDGRTGWRDPKNGYVFHGPDASVGIIHGVNNMDKAVTLQTAILESTKDELKKLQEEHGHSNPGETIGWLIDEVKAMKDIQGD